MKPCPARYSGTTELSLVAATKRARDIPSARWATRPAVRLPKFPEGTDTTSSESRAVRASSAHSASRKVQVPPPGPPRVLMSGRPAARAVTRSPGFVRPPG